MGLIGDRKSGKRNFYKKTGSGIYEGLYCNFCEVAKTNPSYKVWKEC